MNVLVTGGAGYIGSHAALRLLAEGHAVTIVDDLSRGSRDAIETLDAAGDVRFVEDDFGDRAAMKGLLLERSIETVMHFAALTYVGESVETPLRYYRTNVAGTVSLLEAMEACGVRRMVFSSSCATYGQPSAEHVPIREDCPQQPANPYGRTKLIVEKLLEELLRARPGDFACAALRYFNVAGCDVQGRLGERHDPETHLIPICLEAALGRRDAVTINGTDYPTHDGTCVRDFVHVDDVVDAHVAVMNALAPGSTLAYNVGTGRGASVREVIDACRRVTGADIAVREGPRRPGDPAVLYADPSRIKADLGWTAAHTDLDEIVGTAWRWFKDSHEPSAIGHQPPG